MTAKKRHASKLIEKVASNIKYQRMKNGLSQERLGDETGLAIERYESGRYDLTLTTINVLAERFNIEPHILLQ